MAGVVHIPWYATGFRGDRLAVALAELSAVAPRYGATGYSLYRSRDDRYSILQILNFENKLDWERYWHSPEFDDFRVVCSGWFQIPLTYAWHDLIAFEQLPTQQLTQGSARRPSAVGK